MNAYWDDYGSQIIEYDFPKDVIGLPVYRKKYHGIHQYINNPDKPFLNEYIRVNMSMDIETTKVGPYSAPYIITTSLSLPGSDTFHIYHTRNWKDTQDLYNIIAKHYKLGNFYKPSRGRRGMICLVHNLSFEFAFCRKELDFDFSKFGFFTKESRKAMKASLKNGIEFRDSMALSNSSLITLSEDYTKHKKIKDLDYRVKRNTTTPMSADEWRYINEDCIILNEYEDLLFSKFFKKNRPIPLTNTARLLQNVQEKVTEADINKVILMQPSVLEIIEEQAHLFRGGYVHGNLMYLDEDVECLMRDITSSYPYSMLSGYYPMSAWEDVTLPVMGFKYGQESKEFLQLLNTKCVKMKVTYYGIRAKTDHTYESKSKVIFYQPYPDDITKGLDNGRVRKCELMTVYQTELDFECYQLLYEWDAMIIESIKVADRGPLPNYLLDDVIENYKIKNNLKKAGKKDSVEYVIAKVNVNTFFGACCKSVYLDNITYDGKEWTDQKVSLSDVQNELNKRFLNYDWGIWIAALSRAKLVRMLCAIEAAGGHVIYYDTDSLKYIPAPDGSTERIFEEENKSIREANKKNPLLQDEAFYGQFGEGLGEWDAECDKPVKFKTLGAKRYLYQDDVYHLCVAGLPKTAQEHLPYDPFEMFSRHGFKFRGDETDKLRPVYHDDEYDVTITDDLGVTETIHCKSGVTLELCDFDITEKKLYNLFIQKDKYKKERMRMIAYEKEEAAG